MDSDSRRTVEKHVPYKPHPAESLRIRYDSPSDWFIYVSEGSKSGKPAFIEFRSVASPNVVREIIHIFLRNSELDLHHELVGTVIDKGAVRGSRSR